jgi:hypothetical protein
LLYSAWFDLLLRLAASSFDAGKKGRLWPKADTPTRLIDVRFWGKGDWRPEAPSPDL